MGRERSGRVISGLELRYVLTVMLVDAGGVLEVPFGDAAGAALRSYISPSP